MYLENYFYIFTVALIFYVFLWLRKIFRKEWIASAAFLWTLKILILVPFWAAYFYVIFPFAFPYVENYIYPTDNLQPIIIENTENIEQKFLLIGRKFKSDIWEPVYDKSPLNLNKTPIYTIKKHDLLEITARSGTKDYDIIGIVKLTGFRYKSDPFIGYAFSVPSVPIKVYSHEFWQSSKFEKVQVEIKKELLLFILSFAAALGILFHAISIKGKLILRVILYALFSLIFGLSAYLAYQTATTLVYFLR